MSKPGPYILHLRDLPASRKLEVPAARVEEWLRGHPMRDALGAPADDPEAGEGTAELELYADGEHVFAVGSFRGKMTVACSRCIGPVVIGIDEKIRVTFMPAHELPDETGEGEDDGTEVAKEDLDLFPYEGDSIDLEPLLREQFVLSIPFAPLCKEACLGLCAQCGTDLNTGTCSCEAPIDPRLAALKGLKLPS